MYANTMSPNFNGSGAGHGQIFPAQTQLLNLLADQSAQLAVSLLLSFPVSEGVDSYRRKRPMSFQPTGRRRVARAILMASPARKGRTPTLRIEFHPTNLDSQVAPTMYMTRFPMSILAAVLQGRRSHPLSLSIPTM